MKQDKKNKLTLLENQCLDAQRAKKVDSKTFVVMEAMAKKLEPRDYFYTKKCLNVLKEDLNKKKKVKDTIFKVFELKENLTGLLAEKLEKTNTKTLLKEEQFKRGQDLENIKGVAFSTTGEGSRDLETINVDFSVMFTPPGNSKASVGRELERIIVRAQQLGYKILRELSKDPLLKGTGTWESNLRATPVPPGKAVKATALLTVDTTYGKDDDESSFEDYCAAISKGLSVLDSKVYEWLEIDNADEENIDAPKDEDEDAADKNYAKSEEEFEGKSEEEIEADILANLKKKGDETITEEATTEDIAVSEKPVSKEKQLAIDLLTEKIQRISGKKVILEKR